MHCGNNVQKGDACRESHNNNNNTSKQHTHIFTDTVNPPPTTNTPTHRCAKPGTSLHSHRPIAQAHRPPTWHPPLCCGCTRQPRPHHSTVCITITCAHVVIGQLGCNHSTRVSTLANTSCALHTRGGVASGGWCAIGRTGVTRLIRSTVNSRATLTRKQGCGGGGADGGVGEDGFGAAGEGGLAGKAGGAAKGTVGQGASDAVAICAVLCGWWWCVCVCVWPCMCMYIHTYSCAQQYAQSNTIGHSKLSENNHTSHPQHHTQHAQHTHSIHNSIPHGTAQASRSAPRIGVDNHLIT